MTVSRGLSVLIAYTTAALTPNAVASMGAANTKTDTTRPIMQALRPNSVSSPPHNMVPPAMAIPIRPTAYATGPVSDVAIVCMGRSHGRLPAAAAGSRALNAHAHANRVASLRWLIRCILKVSLKFVSCLNVLDRVFPTGVPGDEQNLSDLSSGGELRLLIDEDDEVNRFRNQRLLWRAGRLGDQAFQTDQPAQRIIGVNRGKASGMTCIPCFEHRVRFRATDLSDDDTRGLQPHTCAEAVEHRHVPDRAKVEVVLNRALQLGR